MRAIRGDYICFCVFTNRCRYVYMYTYIHICIYVSIYIHVWIDIYMYFCSSLPQQDWWMGVWIVSMLQDYSLQPRRCLRGTDAIGMRNRNVFGRAGAEHRHSFVPRWVQVRSDRSGHVDNEVAGGDVRQLTQTGLGFENELALPNLSCKSHLPLTFFLGHGQPAFCDVIWFESLPGTSIVGKARPVPQLSFASHLSPVISHLSLVSVISAWSCWMMASVQLFAFGFVMSLFDEWFIQIW